MRTWKQPKNQNFLSFDAYRLDDDLRYHFGHQSALLRVPTLNFL
jgi:hypothetical protein